jgi:hypothetical protein
VKRSTQRRKIIQRLAGATQEGGTLDIQGKISLKLMETCFGSLIGLVAEKDGMSPDAQR